MNLARTISEWTEAVRIAGEQLMLHKVRSLLTALGVIIGVWAVILMGTAIKGIDKGFNDSMDMIGDDILYIQRWPWKDIGDDWPKYVNRPNIEVSDAAEINDWIDNHPESLLRIAAPTTETMTNVRRKNRDASRIYVWGSSADSSMMNTADLLHGRFFTYSEELSRSMVTVLGYDVADALFPEGIDHAVGETVTIRNYKFRVIGVMERQGSFLGMQSMDKQVSMPYTSMSRISQNKWGNSLRVQIIEGADTEIAVDQLTGVYRGVRNLLPGEENDFEINRSEALEDQLGPIKTGLAIAGFGITGLALFVGAIGIANITFVSVKERTREIGTRRAIGARRRAILLQFLAESVSICLLGGIIGILLAFGTKSLLSKAAPNFPFTFSSDLIIMAFGLSVVVGILSGLAPAWQAARLDPANALRHE
jgi:putative ABC transport system permease protein